MSFDARIVVGKRLAAIDYGERRIGIAVCDELHIVVSTRPVILNDATMWKTLLDRLESDRIDVVLVGVPRKHDDTSSPIIERILGFIDELREKTTRPVFDVDEAFSTQHAKAFMLSGGMKKKKRQEKGQKDAIAAAIILRDFLAELR